MNQKKIQKKMANHLKLIMTKVRLIKSYLEAPNGEVKSSEEMCSKIESEESKDKPN
jgi:hypothetical protein